MGIGTGMQQNARVSMHIETPWNIETEDNRYLVELGPVGFLLVWLAKLGLMVALFRGYKMLKKAGRRGSAASSARVRRRTMFGNLTFDHNWQALYFMGCGFVLAEVVSVRAAATAMPAVVEASRPVAVPSTGAGSPLRPAGMMLEGFRPHSTS